MVLFFLLLLLFSSCANKGLVRVEKIKKELGEGQYDKALEKVRDDYRMYGDKDAFLYHLDQGILLHYVGQYDESLSQLKRCEQILEEHYATDITDQAASFLTNDFNKTYKSRPYEITALHTFLMLNYLAKGSAEAALVESRKAQLRFDEWFRQDEKEYNEDGFFHFLSALAYFEEAEEDNARISLYKSVRAYKENGMAVPQLISDFAYMELKKGKRDADILKLGLKIPSPERQDDLRELMNPNGSELVVLNYAGQMPIIGEQRYAGMYISGGMLNLTSTNSNGEVKHFTAIAPVIPAEALTKHKLGKGVTTYITFAVPVYQKAEYKAAGIELIVDADRYSGEMVHNYADLLHQNLQDNHDETFRRTVVRVALKTAISEASKGVVAKHSGGNPWVELAYGLAADAGTAALEKADTRLCFLLPRSIQMIRIPVQAGSHNLMYQLKGTNGETLEQNTLENVKVKPGKKKFVLIPAVY